MMDQFLLNQQLRLVQINRALVTLNDIHFEIRRAQLKISETNNIPYWAGIKRALEKLETAVIGYLFGAILSTEPSEPPTDAEMEAIMETELLR